MTALATVVSPFAIVVIVVGVLGCVAGLAFLIRGPSAFGDERGQLWIFHGEPDTGPIRCPGSRDHDRHVLDPEPDTAPPVPALRVVQGGAATPHSSGEAAPHPKTPPADD